ncbi:transglycosylase SLT domain-containing protein [Pseudoduganella sp. FT25W]|uniref:Transglycosylase SLT domain-containing protein n=1 Tax=Duganella alba TaxID=2666081 RepID=A0A6L5QNG8_9BURK|nr:lytic transglycosylase domain-containing protein [Duganella alba]MRX11403.1 transglycosylase SLT domain-containing protein [Duganella alba]MRX19530.1 transglycosylase SLT domain-containing protein [Duganella alba]
MTALLRRTVLAAATLLALAAAAPLALAGNQKEEALADAVRLALSNAIKDATPPTPSFRNPSDQARYQNWLETMSYRLKRKLPDDQTRNEFLATVWYEARRAGLDPGMVLGLIQVESAYRKYAVSIVGARGYMQVMPFWTNIIGDRNRSALFNMQTNLRYGCSILRMYLDMEAGNLYLALGRYNGSRGKPDYPNAVLAAWNNWK